MPDPDETQTITGWRTASRFYRKTPGLGWLLAVLAIPLLLGLVGWVALDKSDVRSGPTLPSASPSASGPAVAGALSIQRRGNDVTLAGELPDPAAKTNLLDTLEGVFGPDVNLVDNLDIKSGITLADLSGLGSVFKAASDVPDFGWKLDGDTVAMTGAAPSDDVKSAVEAAATAAWPNTKIDNQIQVAPAPAPEPEPAPDGACGNLQADVNGLLSTPINFDTAGGTFSSDSEQTLTAVAATIKVCPDSRIAVTGYTDNSGNDAINVPLSADRAKSVADFLVSQGVAVDHVTSTGMGSANPIASNDTVEGRALNRRVEITVS